MIKKIYGLLSCKLCRIAKEKFPEAEYILIESIDSIKRAELENKCYIIGQIKAPILLDENNNIIKHEDVGL